MALTPLHVTNICLVWTGHKTCRYHTTGDDGKNYCLKKTPAEKKRIDKEVAALYKQAKENGQKIRDFGRAIGDNCDGYLILKYLKQGYDVDKK